MDSVLAAQGPVGSQPWLVADQNSLVPTPKSFLKCHYDNSDDPDAITSIDYRIGGPSGVLVATVVVTYNAEGNIETVERV